MLSILHTVLRSRVKKMADDVYDVIIIGGSLAGSSLGILLADSGMNVLILEKSGFPRNKVCGEFLSPAVWPLFDAMKLTQAVVKLGGATIREVRFYSTRKTSSYLMPYASSEHPFGLGLSRARLDDFLLKEAMMRGCRVIEYTQAVHLETSFDIKKVHTQSEGLKEKKYQGRCVVNAAGSFNRWIQSPQSKDSKKIGFKTHFVSKISCPNSLRLYLFDSGYLGISPVEKNQTNLCGWFNSEGLNRNLDEFIQALGAKHPAFREWLNHSCRNEEWVTSGTLAPGLRKSTISETFLVGDAFAFVEPFIGQGMTFAFLSSWLLYQHLLIYFKGRYALGQISKAYQKHLRGFYESRFFWGRTFRLIHQLRLNELLVSKSPISKTLVNHALNQICAAPLSSVSRALN